MIAGVVFPFPGLGLGSCHCCVSRAEAELLCPSLGRMWLMAVWVLSVPIRPDSSSVQVQRLHLYPGTSQDLTAPRVPALGQVCVSPLLV